MLLVGFFCLRKRSNNQQNDITKNSNIYAAILMRKKNLTDQQLSDRYKRKYNQVPCISRHWNGFFQIKNLRFCGTETMELSMARHLETLWDTQQIGLWRDTLRDSENLKGWEFLSNVGIDGLPTSWLNSNSQANMFWLPHEKRVDENDRFLAIEFNYQGSHQICI